jgi:DNA-directed RNA polymerase subunit E'/Rpb7
MLSPFIDTILYTKIGLHASQLDNNIYSNLKQNLIHKLVGRCYLNYGYISKIYEILERSNPHLITEDNMASTIFNVKFSCRLCHPMDGQQIICKITQITDTFIKLERLPIHVFITPDRINKTNFTKDLISGKIKITKTLEDLEKELFVKVTIMSKTMTHKDERIIAVGILDDVANEKEIEQFYGSEYEIEKKIVNYDEYIKKGNVEKSIVEKDIVEKGNTEKSK